jgi:glycosyltransferase involved in cell wall biosynthesis
VPGLMDATPTSMRSTVLLMVSHYFEEHRGGVEIVADALAREMTLLGFQVVRLATGPLSHAPVELRGRTSTLSASNALEDVLKLPYPLPFASAWRAIWVEAKRADLILVHDAFYLTSIIAFCAARFYRKPFLVVQHIGLVPYQNALLRNLMTVANRLITVPILRRADQVIFISQLTSRYFANLRLRHAPALIFNGVDTRVFFPPADQAEINNTRKIVGLPPKASVALFVGRFIEKKGLAVLWRMARARPDIFFVFAGWGSIDPATWNLANVRVYGSLSGPSLAALYRACDILLLPSVGEGFPLVVQEALACGLPIICGIDTAQADSRAAPFLKGVKVNIADPDRTARLFSEETTRVLAQPETEADRLKRFVFAKNHYSWAGSAADYARVLRRFVPIRNHPVNQAMSR